jgi:ABC-type glycerol-3-phosphate transport system substrate-binding protein
MTLFVVIAALPAAAQSWQQTVEAANKEGELIVQSQPNQAARDFILREFPKAYPAIKVSLSVVPDAQFQVRVRTERQAEKYLWDVAVAGFTGGYTLSKEGIVDPFLPELVDPDVNRSELWGGWDEAFMDKEKKYVFAMSAFIASPWYDALKVAPEKVERLGLKILNEPELEGKTVWHDPTVQGSGTSYAVLVRLKLGDDGLKKAMIDQKPLMVPQQNQVVEAMARGTHWIGIGPPVRSLIAPFTQAGIRTDIRGFGPSPDANLMAGGGSGIYVFNKRPHPNATRVFVNWLLSRDVQHAMAKALDQASRRQDVPTTTEPDNTAVKGAKYFQPQREENEPLRDDTRKLIASWRR